MRYAIYIVIILLFCQCSKEFLEASPSSNLITPTELTVMEGLVYNHTLMAETPVIGEQSSDDYYMTDGFYDILPPMEKNIYTWQADIFEGRRNIPDWNIPYAQVYNCNIVLKGLTDVEQDPVIQQKYYSIKGAALFLRSFAFYNLAQLFAVAYDKSTAGNTLGIALPLVPDIDQPFYQRSLQDCYQQITKDLNEAARLLLPDLDHNERYKPNRMAAYALLARVYLSMNDYAKAGAAADSCLKYYNKLLDFNTLDFSYKYPVPESNAEVLYQSWLNSSNLVIVGRKIKDCMIAPALYNSYDSTDLRKEAFFLEKPDGTSYFKCNYTGKSFAFSGLAVDEVFLIAAESQAWQGNVEVAMQYLNTLLKNRIVKKLFAPLQASSKNEALQIIRKERRKELVFRGLRWTDLRRLNMEEAHIELSRTIGNEHYELLPNSKRYVFPIPDDALEGSNIIQNERN